MSKSIVRTIVNRRTLMKTGAAAAATLFAPNVIRTAQAAERIAKAQASRGADWGSHTGGLFQRVRQVLPLIVPLFLTSLRRAENLALAMEARGYGSQNRRTSMFVMKLQASDVFALVVSVLIALIVLL